MFFINQPLFLQKTKPLYLNNYLGLGFEFGPQRIRDLVIVSLTILTNFLSEKRSRDNKSMGLKIRLLRHY